MLDAHSRQLPDCFFPVQARPAVHRLLRICVEQQWCDLFGELRRTCPEFLCEANSLMPRMATNCPHTTGCDKTNCRCDCESMKQHRVTTAVREFACGEECSTTYWISDYSKFREHVCRRCFITHWRGTGVRPLKFCLVD
jgi:hypothetical protein